MDRLALRAAALLLVAIAASGCRQDPEKAGDTAAEETTDYEALAMAVIDMGDAVNAEDLDAFLEHFAEDYTEEGGAVGKSALRGGLEAVFQRGDLSANADAARLDISGNSAEVYPFEMCLNGIRVSVRRIFFRKNDDGRWEVASTAETWVQENDSVQSPRAQLENPELQY